MRTERNKDGSWNVWMSREEYRALPRAAESFDREVAIRLMGDCGLRAHEVLDVTPEHISRMSDGRHYELDGVGDRPFGETNPALIAILGGRSVRVDRTGVADLEVTRVLDVAHGRHLSSSRAE